MSLGGCEIRYTKQILSAVIILIMVSADECRIIVGDKGTSSKNKNLCPPVRVLFSGKKIQSRKLFLRHNTLQFFFIMRYKPPVAISHYTWIWLCAFPRFRLWKLISSLVIMKHCKAHIRLSGILRMKMQWSVKQGTFVWYFWPTLIATHFYLVKILLVTRNILSLNL